MKISHLLIRKYLRNECTGEEMEQVHLWYNSYELDDDPLPGLTDLELQQLKDRMFSRIQRNIASCEPEERKAVRIARLRPIAYAVAGTAAMFLLVLAGSFLLSRSAADRHAALPNGKITVLNSTTSIHKILLPDSSRVWLSPGSKIEHPRYFGSRARRVELEGEAFFEVKHDKRHPFVIKSGGVLTKVLGTSFRIRAYSRNNSTEVSVLTGKVTVSTLSDRTKEVVLLPKDKATYSKSTHSIEKGEDSSESMALWKRASLRFKDVPVARVAEVLNERFNVRIVTYDEEIKGYLLNGDFSDQNLPDVLSMLEQSLNISYQITDTYIILRKKRS